MLSDRRPILLANARIVDPSRDLDFPGDLLIADGLIRDTKRGIGAAGVPEGTEVVDCKGRIVAPGLIDMRAFVGEPGAEYRDTLATASQAAAAGGVTTIVCQPDTSPVIDDPAIVDFVLRRARDTSIVHVQPMAALTKGLRGEEVRFAQMAAGAGLGSAVHLLGWMPVDALPDVFAAADVALYPLDDTLLNRTKCVMKLVDLLLAGVPVVADAVGQAAEYVEDGGTGLLVPPGDVAAMARAAVALLREAAKGRALGEAARADMLARWIGKPMVTLGTDGFGRSEDRASLRKFFEVNDRYVAAATLATLHREGQIGADVVRQAFKDLEIDPEKVNPAHA